MQRTEYWKQLLTDEYLHHTGALKGHAEQETNPALDLPTPFLYSLLHEIVYSGLYRSARARASRKAISYLLFIERMLRGMV